MHIVQLRDKDAAPVNWVARQKAWHEAMDRLLDEIERWLSPLIEKKLLEFVRYSESLNEQYLGDYQINGGIISVENQEMRLKPRGSLVVAAYGRCDLIGPKAGFTIVLDFEDEKKRNSSDLSEAVWFVVDPKNRAKLKRFTKEAFEEIFAIAFGMDGDS